MAWLVVPLDHSCQISIRTWLVYYLHLHSRYMKLCSEPEWARRIGPETFRRLGHMSGVRRGAVADARLGLA